MEMCESLLTAASADCTCRGSAFPASVHCSFIVFSMSAHTKDPTPAQQTGQSERLCKKGSQDVCVRGKQRSIPLPNCRNASELQLDERAS